MRTQFGYLSEAPQITNHKVANRCGLQKKIGVIYNEFHEA